MQNQQNYNHQNQHQQNNEEEIPLYEENVVMHQVSSPTTGKKHSWHQEGPHVICDSCESTHGFYIGMNKRIKSIDEEGNIIIENV